MVRDWELASNSVHIWIANLKSLQNTSLLHTGLLTQVEQTRRSAFATPKLQNSYLYSHAILKLLLCKYLKTIPSKIWYKYGMYNKPFIDLRDQQIAFNLSHAVDWVACAFSSDLSIGIDIEEKSREISTIDIVDLVCNATERSTLKSMLLPRKKKDYFLKLWTAKEAILKMLGLGIGDYLPKIFFDPSWKVNCYDNKEHMFIGKIEHINHLNYIASVGYNSSSADVIVHELKDIRELMV